MYWLEKEGAEMTNMPTTSDNHEKETLISKEIETSKYMILFMFLEVEDLNIDLNLKAETTTGVNKEPKLILLEPGPSTNDYTFGMDKNEGISEMFDISLEK